MMSPPRPPSAALRYLLSLYERLLATLSSTTVSTAYRQCGPSLTGSYL